MAAFLNGQIDYILFVGGLCFLVVSAVCFALQRPDGRRLPWVWVGIFALAYSAALWHEVLDKSLPGDNYEAIAACLMFLSLVSVTEFACRGAALVHGRPTNRRMLLVLLALTVLGGVAGFPGIMAAARYSLGLVGGLSAVALLFAAAKKGGPGARSLRALGVFAGAYGLVAGVIVPKAGLFPANLINQDSFRHALGIDVGVIQSVLALGIAISVWCYCQALRRAETGREKCSRLAIATPLAIGAILLVGWVLTATSTQRCDSKLRDDLVARAQTAATAVDPLQVATLSASHADTSKPQFEFLRRRLKAVRAANPDCRFVYLMTRHNGRMVFLADAEPVGSNDYSAPGDVYADATPRLAGSLVTGESFVEGPMPDEWGTWVSGIVPIRESPAGNVVALLGMDVDARDWARQLAQCRLNGILLALLVCAAMAGFLVVLQNKEDFAVRIAHSEQRYRNLVEGSPNLVCLLDSQGRCLKINQAGLRAMGWEEADTVGRSFEVLWPEHVRARIEAALGQALDGAQSSLEAEFTRTDGERLIWRVVFNSVAESSEHGLGVVIVADDVTGQKKAEQALREAEEKYRQLAENASDIIWTMDLDGRLTYVSSSVRQLGYEPEDWIGTKAIDYLPPKDRDILRRQSKQQLRETGAHRFEVQVPRRDGSMVWVEVSAKFIFENQKPVCIQGTDRDISERKRAEAELRTHISAMNAASDQIVITDPDGCVKSVNRAFEKETGYEAAEVLGKNLRLLNSGKQNRAFYQFLWNTILSGETWHGEVINRRKDGSMYNEDMSITPVKNEDGSLGHFIAIKRNITDKKVYEERLDHLAHHDPLTALPNRLLFSDRLSQQLALAQRQQEQLGVMFIDLDRFKLINDTLGHNVGDMLLREVSERLGGYLRGVDTVSRMGGDEFTIILPGITGSQEAANVAQRILEVITQPYHLQGRELVVTASIGISVYPSDGADVETLVRNADTAMYRAKEQGRNNYQFYTEALNMAALERMNLESSLRKAVERNELLMHYQPRVDIETGEILGVEALLRWQHPVLGLVPPGQFIPLAEETGLIVPISEWVLETACRQNKAWQDEGLQPVEVSVNITARQLQHEAFAAAIKRVLKQTRLAPKWLGLEMTESTLMHNPDLAATVLCKLKAMGVCVSIDDFGTGYSSLSYIKRLPINAVKIDQSFVKDITTNPDDAAIAGAVVAMAHSLKLTVIAEGVETLEQLQFLRSLKCDQIQGYFIGRPVPAAEFARVLRHATGPDAISNAA